MGNDQYDKIKNIFENYLKRQCDYSSDILDILNDNNIKKREKDGKLIQINISIPKNHNNSFIVGLRYLKRDYSHTEDHFLFLEDADDNQKVKSFYKNKLEKKLPEYQNTHKEQLQTDQINLNNSKSNYSDVSTISTLINNS
ncbi:MAG: hypothetical protein OEY59_12275 [Deltaproteobacteria bacterium]|nr:hypothetical protein [Deltaproteobacteria bacterium]